MEMIYSENGASHFNLYGLQNTSDDLIVNIVMGTMFVVLPAFWLGALTWAGIRIGGAMAGTINNSIEGINKANQKGAPTATSTLFKL